MKPVISNINPEPFDLKTSELDVYLPHHITVRIRERNGEDERILSTVEDFISGKAIPKFLASIIVGPQKLTYEDIQNWPSRSKYYLMYMERMAYFGSLVQWDQKFNDANGKSFSVPWEENIARFNSDLKNVGSVTYEEGQIIPYPKPFNPKMEYTTSSGNKYRLDYLTGFGELEAANIPQSELNINSRFVVRNMEAMDKNGKWHIIQNFKNISPRDTSELRKFVDKNDPDFALAVTLTNPKTKETGEISLFGINSFFFQ